MRMLIGPLMVVVGLLGSSAPAFAQFGGCPETPPRFEATYREGRVWLFWGDELAEGCQIAYYAAEISRSPFSTDTTFYFGRPTDRQKQALPLLPPGEWFIRMFAVSTLGGKSLPTETIQVRIHEQPSACKTPPAPAYLSATVGAYVAGQGTQVTLVWSSGGTMPGCQPPGYLLVVGLAPDRVDAVLDLGAARAPLTLLAPRGRYYVRLVAYAVGVGQSAPSGVIRVEVP